MGLAYNKLILFIVVLANFLYATEFEPPQPPSTAFSSDLNTSLLVDGCVDVASLSTVINDHLITVDGPDPIVLSRTSAGNNPHKGTMGFGFGIDIPWRIFKVRKEGGRYFASWTPREGTREELTGKQEGEVIVLRPVKDSFLHGRSNLGSGFCGRTDGSNVEFRYLDGDRFEVLVGDGTRRYYLAYGKPEEKQFVLHSERLPSGNWRYYDFDDSQRLKRIETRGADETMVNFIDLVYEPDKVNLRASDGQCVTLFLNKEVLQGQVNDPWDDRDLYDRKTLTHAYRISGNNQPSKEYIIGAGKWLRGQLKIREQTFPGGWRRVFGYKDQGRWVSSIQVADSSGYLNKKWTFEASDDANSNLLKRIVVNALGAKSRYVYDRESLLLQSIEHPEVSEKYTWEPAQKHRAARLKHWALYNNEKEFLKSLEFTYDERGNVLKETLTGCLIAEGSLDKVTREYTYSDDGFNLMLSAREPGGLITQYRYKPGTNLLISLWQQDQDHIFHRTFYQYDEYANLIARIEDDGSSENSESLSDVTWRKITRSRPHKQIAGFGKPAVLTSAYLDLYSGEERQLSRIVNHFDDSGLCTQADTYDANDQLSGSQTWLFNAQRLCVRQVDALGAITEFTYDDRRNLASEHWLSTGQRTYYCYDVQNRLCEARQVYPDLDECRETKQWHLAGQLLQEVDRYGSVTTYSYDKLGRLTQTTDSAGTTNFEHNSLNQVVARVDGEGYRTETVQNVRGQPLRIKYPDGSEQQYRYNQQGLCTEEVQKDGSRVTSTYDALGNCTLRVHAKGTYKDVTLRRFKSSQLLSEQQQGLNISHRYDQAGRLIATLSGDRQVTHVYDAMGRLSQTHQWIDTKNYIAKCTDFDLLNRPIAQKTVHSDGTLLSASSRRYDLKGNVVAERLYHSEDNHAETTYTHNSAGEVQQKTNPLGVTTRYQVDHHGRRTEYVFDPLGRQSVSTYDPAGRLAEVLRYSTEGTLLGAVRYQYDARGLKIREETDVYRLTGFERTYSISYSYDALGNCIGIQEPGRSTQFTYDSLGRLLTTRKSDGTLLVCNYSDAGDITSLRSSDGTVDHFFEYDRRHNCIEGTDRNSGHTVVRRYNPFGDLLFESREGLEQSYSYDRLGLRTSFQLPLGLGSVTYSRQSGHLSAITRRGTQSYTHRYTHYDLLGHPCKQQLIGASGNLDTEYDLIGRVSHIRSDSWELRVPENGYNSIGLLEEQTIEDALGGYTFKVSYDPWDQLQTERGAFNHAYEHDSLENRRLVDETLFEIGDHNELQSIGDTVLKNDANGNPITHASCSYTYDALGRLTQLATPDLRVTYQYDVFGRRIEKNIERREPAGWVASDREFYLWDGENEIGALDSGKQVRQLRILGLGYGLEVGAAIALELEGSLFAPIHDSLGNVCSLINSSTGRPAATYRYSAFGECDALQTNGPHNPWRYSSKRHDSESALVFFGQRYYRPEQERWLTTDPLGLADGPNTYCYAHNKPVTLIDPTGLWSKNTEEQSCSQWLCQGGVDFVSGIANGCIDGFAETVHLGLQLGHASFDTMSFAVTHPCQAASRAFDLGVAGCAHIGDGGLAAYHYAQSAGWTLPYTLAADSWTLAGNGAAKVSAAGSRMWDAAIKMDAYAWGHLTGEIGFQIATTKGMASGGSLLLSSARSTGRTIAEQGGLACMRAAVPLAGESALAARLEINAGRILLEMEKNAGSGAHFLSRHGAQTTLEQQLLRAATGMTPDGFAGIPRSASRFLSHRDQLRAVTRASTIYNQTGRPAFELSMEGLIGEGYFVGGGHLIQTAHVKAVFKAGQLYTVYPHILKGAVP